MTRLERTLTLQPKLSVPFGGSLLGVSSWSLQHNYPTAVPKGTLAWEAFEDEVNFCVRCN